MRWLAVWWQAFFERCAWAIGVHPFPSRPGGTNRSACIRAGYLGDLEERAEPMVALPKVAPSP
eukprot:3076333-Prorocentrum_lima.AAC.1